MSSIDGGELGFGAFPAGFVVAELAEKQICGFGSGGAAVPGGGDGVAVCTIGRKNAGDDDEKENDAGENQKIFPVAADLFHADLS